MQATIYLGPHRVARRLGSLREPMRAAQELALLSQMRFFLSLALTLYLKKSGQDELHAYDSVGRRGAWISGPSTALRARKLLTMTSSVFCHLRCVVARRSLAHLRLRVARAMAPALEVMSCVGGDWNYVSESGDLRTLTTMDEAGERDRNEELHFVNRLGKPFGLMELKQEAMTHQSWPLPL